MAADPTTAPRTRDPWFDNAKMALVLLVVVGHSWVMLPGDVVNSHLYSFLYFWHVPAFVLVTGFLSRSFDWSSRRMVQLIQTVAVPYVLFEAALALFRLYVGGERLADLWQDPHWPMWYLSALFFWRLATPVFKAMPAALAVAVAVAISVLGGLVADYTLDFFRICGLLPFFVLGLTATPEALERLRGPRVRRAAPLVFAGVLALTWGVDAMGGKDWLYYSYPYSHFAVSTTQALLIRAGLLVVGTVGGVAFLALVPRRNGWFTRMGAATLVVYLFHGFVVKSFEYAGWPAWADTHRAVSLLVTTAGAAGLAMLLAVPAVASRLNHLVDPFAYARRHVDRAVALTGAHARTEVMAEAIAEASQQAAEQPVAQPVAQPALEAVGAR